MSPQTLALSFDDGPHLASLTAVLDVLKAHAVPAAFFFNTYANDGWLGSFNSPGTQVWQIAADYMAVLVAPCQSRPQGTTPAVTRTICRRPYEHRRLLG
jgi:peptidoglycan/xylan/chitin deacetylase (PgdA/CDA1 family)